MSVNGKFKAQVIAMVSPETRLALIDAAKEREVSLSQHLRETLEQSLAETPADLRTYGKALVAEPEGEPEPPNDGDTAMDRMRRRGLI